MRKNLFLWLILSLVSITNLAALGKQESYTALLIIPDTEVQDKELKVTKKVLEDAGIGVSIASTNGNEVKGMLGGSFIPDMKVSEIQSLNYNLVACIGGTGAFNIFENNDIISLLKKFYKEEKVVAGICAAPAILANAGVLNGVDAT